MFSANENLMLREHKRRVVNYIEATIPESLLDLGTSVMVMQTACRTPGCVPLETAIAIVFPRIKHRKGEELMPGIKESDGGTYKAKVLLPLAQVTNDDVLDALPPAFQGGRKTWESTCFTVRDLVFGRIGGLVGSGNEEGEVDDRRVLAQYLRMALDDYLERDCVAPVLGQPFDKLDLKKEVNVDVDVDNSNSNSIGTENNGSNAGPGAEVVLGSMIGTGNFVIRRKDDSDDEETKLKSGTIGNNASSTALVSQSDNMTVDRSLTQPPSLPSATTISTTNTNSNATVDDTVKRSESAMDWRRRQNMTQSLQLGQSSDNILLRLAEREHAPGVRSPGCPCCDPDNIGNIVEGMLL